MRRVLPLLLALLALTGCTEAEEHWSLDRKGGGEYALTLRWNADLWRRVRGVLGAKVSERLAGHGFPLKASAWRDGLKELEGVTILELEERDTESGMQEIHLRARFKKLEQILRWEVLAGRTVRIEHEKPDPTKKDAPLRATLYMEPIARVPVLDRVAALVEATEKPPPKAEGAAAARDPGPLARMGIERTAAELVWRMVKLPLGKVALRSRITLPGDLVSIRGTGVDEETREARFAWSFADLRRVDADRTIRLRWRKLAFEEAPDLEHAGRRDPRPRAPDGSKK